jgi:hypothetical protein
MFYQSSLLVVLSYVINPVMFLFAMLVSSVKTLDFRSIGRHLVPHNVLI